MTRAQRFAYEQLPQWTRRQAALTTLAARTFFTEARRSGSTSKALDARFGALFDDVEYTLRLPEVHSHKTLLQAYTQRPTIATIFSVTSESILTATAAVFALDAPVARWMAARALGLSDQEAVRWMAPMEWTPGMEGAYAMACTQAAWRACSPGILPIFRAATESWDDVAHALGSGDWVQWTVHVRAGSVSGLGTILLPTRALKARPSLDAQSYQRVVGLDVTAHLVAGSARFSAQDVARWTIGELLLLEGLSQSHDEAVVGPMLVRVGAGECNVMVEPKRIVAQEALRPRKASMTSDSLDPKTDPIHRASLLATLTVEVEVIIAKTTMTVGEVSEWRPGEVIALPTPVGTPVEVRAGGRLVARGELCTVDQQIAVRITELI